MRKLLVSIFAVAVCTTSTLAQDYPNKPIRLVVPFAPGGPTDIAGRITAEYLSKRIGQPVIVENKPGAGTSIGLDLVAKSSPDGYTLALATSDGISILPALRRNLPYEVTTDLTFVATLAQSAPLIAVPVSLPFKTLQDLIAYAKSNPGKLRYGSSGVGGGAHLSTALIAKEAGIELTHIPYQGAGPAVTAVVSGVVDFVMSGGSTIKPHIDSGKLRALATSGKQRDPKFPDVPTLNEAGLKGLGISLHYGIVAPAGTAPAVVQRLEKEISSMVRDSETSARLLAVGITPSFLGGDDFKALALKDLETWKDTAKSANIVLQQ